MTWRFNFNGWMDSVLRSIVIGLNDDNDSFKFEGPRMASRLQAKRINLMQQSKIDSL